MKKNAPLVFILIALLGLTYFVQEKRTDENYEAALTKDRLFQDEITELKLANIEMKKKDGQWFAGEKLLSHNSLNQIEKRLKEIKTIKPIQGEWQNFFSSGLEFGVNGKSYTLGNTSLDQQGFYVGSGKEIFLAIIDGGSHELSTDEKEIAVTKFNELKGQLTKELKDLQENQLFRYYPKLPFNSVAIESEGKLSFELDLKNDQTTPAIAGINVHEDLAEKFRSLLTQVTLREELPYSEKLKYQKMSSMTFTEGARRVHWELWLISKKSADAVIIDTEAKKAYLMVGGTLRPFFINLQDFWDKKNIPPQNFESFDKLTIPFVEGNKASMVEVQNREPLKITAKGFKVQPENMDRLFQLVFNLRQYDQAERVSILAKSERMQVLSEKFLRLELMGQELVLWQKLHELIVVNLTQGYKAHYARPDKSVGFHFEDVLK